MRVNIVGQDRSVLRATRGLIVIVACLIALPASGEEGASASASASASEDPIVFSLASIAPWAERTPDGEKRGLLVEMVRELHERTGLPLRYQIRPHGRTLLELEEGVADFVPTFVAPGLERIGEHVGDIVTARVLVLGHAGDETIDSLDALNGDNVGYLRGTWYGEVFEQNEQIHKVPVKDVAHGVELLRRGRLKALVSTEIAIPGAYDPESGENPPLDVMLELTRNHAKLYMSRRSDQEKARERISRALQAMHEDGTMDRLFANRFNGR